MTQREAFEAWYFANAFDLAASPLGSRDCALQWNAWQAATKRERERCAVIADEAGQDNPAVCIAAKIMEGEE